MEDFLPAPCYERNFIHAVTAFGQVMDEALPYIVPLCPQEGQINLP